MVIVESLFAALSVGISVGETNIVFDCNWSSNDIRHCYIEGATTTNLENNIWQYWSSWCVSPSDTNLLIGVERDDSERQRFWRFSTWADMDGDGLSNEAEMSQYYTDQRLNDSDGDGVPDDFEIALGMNPKNADAWASVPKLTCGIGGTYATLTAALASSTTNSIIEIQPGCYAWSNITLPDYPLMITSPNGGRNRQVIIVGEGSGGYVLAVPDASRSLIRGLYFDLQESSLLSAIWVGSGSALSGNGGAARIENCYFHLSRKAGFYSAGVYDYRYSKKLFTISGCVFNALGCQYARGCYFYDANPAVVEHCSFLNFPPAYLDLSGGVLYRSSIQNYQGDDIVCPMVVKSSLFDESFTNTYAVGKITGVGFYDVSLHNCLVPNTNCLAECDAAVIDCCVTNSGVNIYGLLQPTSPATDNGGPSALASFDIKGDYRDEHPDIGAAEYIAGADSDIDGDGITDGNECEIGTNPFVADTDWDGVTDDLEVSHGSNPINRNIICCTVALCITNPAPNYLDLRCSVVKAVGSELIGVSDEYAATNALTEIEIPHAIYDLSHSHFLAFKIADETNVLYCASFMPKSHEVTLGVTIPQDVYDTDNDGMADVWELQYGLCPTNAADAFCDNDGDGLINLHEYWCRTSPTNAIENAAGTALSVFAKSIDDRIRSKNKTGAVAVYNDYQLSALTNPNTNCWAYEIDFSCASPWNSANGSLRAGTLISPRHVLQAAHYASPIGTRFYFRGTDNQIYSAVSLATNHIADVDFTLSLLDEEVTNVVTVAKILPPDFGDFIKTGKGLPMLMLDYSEHAIVTDFAGCDSNSCNADGIVPISVDRSRFFEEVVIGDSGDPKFLVCGNEVILICTLLTYGSGCSGFGPFTTYYARQLQNSMDELCPGYQLQVFDFSSFQPLPGE